MKFQVQSYHLTWQYTIIHPAMSQERTTYVSCYVLMLLHNLCGKKEKGKTEQGVQIMQLTFSVRHLNASKSTVGRQWT
jgi:hypothetical protein